MSPHEPGANPPHETWTRSVPDPDGGAAAGAARMGKTAAQGTARTGRAAFGMGKEATKGAVGAGQAAARLAAGDVAGATLKAARTTGKMVGSKDGRRVLAAAALFNPITATIVIVGLVIAGLMAGLLNVASGVASGTRSNQQQSVQDRAMDAARAATKWDPNTFGAVTEISGHYNTPWEVPGALYHVQQAGTDSAGMTAAGMGGVPGEGWVSPMTAAYALTSRFGARSAPVAGASTNHQAIDLAYTGSSTTIVAASSGSIIYAGNAAKCGNMVKIDHGNNYETKYCHLASISVRLGDQVQMGQPIGVEGNTGIGTGAHLHFALSVNKAPQDPLAFYKTCGLDLNGKDIYDQANPKVGCKKDTATTTGEVGSPGAPTAVNAAYSATTLKAAAALRPASRPADATPMPIAETGALNDPAASKYRQLFISKGNQYGISPNFLALIAKIESNFDPSACSGAGACGLMQFTAATAKDWGLSDRSNAEASVDAAARYYVDLIKKYGLSDGVRAYNAGPGNIKRSYGWGETNAYVRKVYADPGVAAMVSQNAILASWATGGQTVSLDAKGGVDSQFCSPEAPTDATATPAANTGTGAMNTPIPSATRKVTGYSEKGMTNDGVRLGRAVAARFGKVTTMYGVGSRSGTSDHPRGGGLDVMTDSLSGMGNHRSPEAVAYGDQVAAYVLANSEVFHVKYVIWKQRMLYPAGSGKQDYDMADRSSRCGPGDKACADNVNHYNHVHISVEGSGYPKGGENYGTLPEGGCTPGTVDEPGIGPLKILESALSEEERKHAEDLRWSLDWATARMRTQLTGEGYSESEGLDAGMMLDDGDKLSINEDDLGAESFKRDYTQALASLPLVGMDEAKAALVVDTARNWHTGHSGSNTCSTSLAATSASSPVSTGLTVPHWNGSNLPVTQAMISNVAVALSVADKYKLTDKGKIIMVATMGVESEYKNVASKKNPESINFPNDGVVDGDLDSVGLFQQRNSWGSIADRMNPAKSAEMFLNNPGQGLLSKIPGYDSDPRTPGQIAQAVQVSKYPDRYDRAVEGAKMLIAAASGVSVEGSCPSGSEGDAAFTGDASEAAKTVIEAALSQRGVPYSWGGGGANGPTRGIGRGAGTVGFDCSGLIAYAYAKIGLHTPGQTGQDRSWAKANGSWHQGMDGIQPGDAAYNDHHVVIYMGGGKMIHAPQTGDVVKVATWKPGKYEGYISLGKLVSDNAPHQ